jgi:hypothetical protein
MYKKSRTPIEIEKKIIKMYETQNSDGTWNGGNTIAKVFGITDTTVQNILRRNGIKTRTPKEAYANGKRTKPIKNLPPRGELPPLCKCNCGISVSWNRAKNNWNNFVNGHYHNANKLYKNRGYLIDEYVNKSRNLIDIAARFEVNLSTISYWMRKNDIPIRKQKESLKLSGRVRGQKNPAWKGGIAKWEYSHDWKSVCKEIKDRDKWTCQGCGEQRKRWGHHLHVHHKDKNKFNNDRSNLISLCDKCHALVHSKNGM